MTPTVTPTSTRADEPADWRIVLTGEDDPLLLARVLQKLTVPEIQLIQMRYDAGAAGRPAGIEATIRARPARARLVTGRLEKLVAVRSVECEPAAKPQPKKRE